MRSVECSGRKEKYVSVQKHGVKAAAGHFTASGPDLHGNFSFPLSG